MSDHEKALQRITAKCESIQDQKWMYLKENELVDIARIAMQGPGPDDIDFVKSVFTLLLFEVTHRVGNQLTE